MATATRSISAFSLKSTWRYGSKTTIHDDAGDYIYYWNPSTPSAASKTVAIDLSAIPAGSRVTSATFSIRTNGDGDSYAIANSVSKGITNDHTGSNAVDVKAWLSKMTGGTFGNLSIKFTFQASSPPPTSSSSSGSRSCSFSASTLTINYELPNSSGTIDVNSIDAGSGSLTITINPTNTSYSHTVTWTFGSQTRTDTLPAGTTVSSWEIPISFCNEIPNATSGTGTVAVATFDTGGAQVGNTQTYTFTVTVPASVVPTAGALAASPVTPGAPSSWRISDDSAQTSTATGDPCVISDGGDNLPLKNLTVAIEPVQAGSGNPSLDNIRPITGWDSIGVTRTGSGGQSTTLTIPVKTASGNTVYGGSLTIDTNGNGTLTVDKVTYTITRITSSYISTATQNCIGIVNEDASPVENNVLGEILCDKLQTKTANGQWTSTESCVAISNLSRCLIMVNGKTNNTELSTWCAENTPQIVYKLATPLTYTFTSSQLTTLLGTNTISADCGAVTAEYYPEGTPSNSVYVQGYSTAAMSLANVSGAYGSTISSVVFSGWGNTADGVQSGTAYTATTSTLTASGTVTLQALVTDSRGRTCTQNLAIVVTSYVSPTISAITAKRCDSNGTINDQGTYCRLVVVYTYASVNNLNNPYTTSAYKLNTDTNYTTATTTAQTFASNTPVIIGGGLLSADRNYDIKVTVEDELGNTATALTSIPTATYVLHFRDGGTAIGVGQAASSTDRTVTVNPNWTVNVGALNVNNIDVESALTDPVAVSRIPNLDASKITSGTLAEARLPDASMYYPGDRISFPRYTVFPGYVWSSKKLYRFCLHLPKKISSSVTSVMLTGHMGAIDYSGYTLQSATFDVTATSGTLETGFGADTGVVWFSFTFSTSRSQGAANAGCIIGYTGDDSLTIEFN